MLGSWNWKKRSYWDNPPNKLFRPIEIKEMLIAPIIKIPTTSKISKNLIQNIQGPGSINSEIADDGSNLGLDLLGRAMIIAGRILIVPEGTEPIVPWTWADEVLGVILIIGGSILVVVF
jgi:hypothetical protein